MNLEIVSSWGNSQVKNDTPPHTRLLESISPLTEEERQVIINYDFPPKRGRDRGNLIPPDYAQLWKAENIRLDGVWQVPPGLSFLQEKLEHLSFIPYTKRIVVHCLETGGWIRPHVDLPALYQIIIPLIQDDGFHFAWEDWGRVQFDTYQAYRVDVERKHAVWNTGKRRVTIHFFEGRFDPGLSLLKVQ